MLQQSANAHATAVRPLHQSPGCRDLVDGVMVEIQRLGQGTIDPMVKAFTAAAAALL
jgi:hypothetical protein